MTDLDSYQPDGRINQETECGTVAGWLRHQHQSAKYGPPCQDCGDAWALFSSMPPPGKGGPRTRKARP